MDAEFARKYLNGEVSIADASQTSTTTDDTTPSEETTPSSEDVKNSEDPKPDEGNGGASSETSTDTSVSDDAGTATQQTDDKKGSEDKPGFLEGKKDKKLPYPNAKETDLEKIKANQAFIRQKDKYKKKVAALENEISDLKTKLMKYSSIDVTKLKDDPEKLMDLKIAKNTLQSQMQNLKDQQAAVMAEQDEIEAEQANRVYQERVATCFPDETEKNHYNTLMNNGREKFVAFLQQYDPENTVLQYLDDCEISPLMVRTLMTNPNALRAVIEKRNPISKAMELRTLENRLRINQRLRTATNPPKSSKPKLPSTGSQTNPGAGSNQDPVRDRNYWKNYLDTHT